MPKTLYAVASFLGSFLLFEVELLIAKAILPHFGGVPAVWTTSLVFFQVTLLFAYLFAHWLVGRAALRNQPRFALAPFALALLGLAMQTWLHGSPVLPASVDGATGPHPALATLAVLSTQVGLPFFALATSSPLLQAWFSRAHPHGSPYRLYAFSNLGAFVGLIAFPTLLEPWLRLRQLALGFSVLFALFTLLFGWAALSARGAQPALGVVARARSLETAVDTPAARRFAWFALAAIPSALLVAVTNQLSRDVAVVPFLWALPLSLYLLSLVACFGETPWYHRGTTAAALVPWLVVALLTLQRGTSASLLLQFAVPSAVLFTACLFCHGELSARRPEPSRLTEFYLIFSAGGAAGGSFAALIPPLIFPDTWEYPLSLFAVAAAMLVVVLGDPATDRDSPLSSVGWLPLVAVGVGLRFAIVAELRPRLARPSDAWLLGIPLAAGLSAIALHVKRMRAPKASAGNVLALRSWAPFITAAAVFSLLLDAAALAYCAYRPLIGARESSRNFFGVVQVLEDAPTPETRRVRLRNGRISHGYQLVAADKRREPTAYYGRESGVGRALLEHPARGRGLSVAVVGLGVGTLAAYARAVDEYRFYEVNPEVIALAGPEGRAFSFLRDAPGKISVVLGDARASLAREGDGAAFDVLVLDAFSGDSIPLHLFTREALALYLTRLAPSGIIAANISNRYLDLKPVASALAKSAGLNFTFVTNAAGEGISRSTWALFARDAALLSSIATPERALTTHSSSPLWTDDHSSLWSVVRW